MDVTPEADEVHPVKDLVWHQGDLHRPRDRYVFLAFFVLFLSPSGSYLVLVVDIDLMMLIEQLMIWSMMTDLFIPSK